MKELPIDRLRHMNPLAIELYRRYKIDIASEPLEFAVNNQHMNGGIMVDTWGRTNLTGCYSVGEAAGTHGVTRPGGAALNAGQVFGTRAAEHVGASHRAKSPSSANIEAAALAGLNDLLAILKEDSRLSAKDIRTEIQSRMSDKAGMICDAESVSQALAGARSLNATIRSNGIAYGRAAEAVRAVQWQQMAIASEAVLTALDYFIRDGGGSRGARAICDADGELVPNVNAGPLHEFRFRRDKDDHRSEQIVVRLEGEDMATSTRPNRVFDESQKSFFERDWPAWLTGRIYDLSEREGCAED